MKHNKTYQIILAAIAVIVIALGWKYKYLGFIVPVVMISAIITSFFNSRFMCGNICPRGLLLNISLPFLSRNKKIPGIFKNIKFRIFMLVIMMGLMSFMLSRKISDPLHWGTVFWTMCSVTTGIGIILGLIYKPRIWCSFCPIGTIQNLTGNHNKKLIVQNQTCKLCLLCEKKCPMGLKIIENDSKETIQNRDCTKCSVCIESCPARSLSWDKQKKCA